MSYLFHGQRNNEEVVLVCKQHPFILFRSFLESVLILLIPLAANIFIDFGTPLAVILVLAILAAVIRAVLAWYSWNNSTLLLTNERVVFLHQKSLLHREFAECTLVGIQQVSHHIKGILHTMFGYGNIAIYTGGSQTPFLLPNIPNPYDIQQEILKASSQEDFREEDDFFTEK